jgi:predicted flap endonuclease-1-like 5' DNA nuclease
MFSASSVVKAKETIMIHPLIEQIAAGGAFDTTEAVRALAQEVAFLQKQAGVGLSAARLAPPDKAKLPLTPTLYLAGSDLEPLGIPPRLVELLRRHGITTQAQLAAIDDEELLALDGIGPATVELIRKLTG